MDHNSLRSMQALWESIADIVENGGQIVDYNYVVCEYGKNLRVW